MGIVEPRHQEQIYFCFICNGPGGTKHHLVPKAVRVQRGALANQVVRCCRPCHDDIHYFFSHWELGHRFNNPDVLKAELIQRKREAATLFLPQFAKPVTTNGADIFSAYPWTCFRAK